MENYQAKFRHSIILPHEAPKVDNNNLIRNNESREKLVSAGKVNFH